MCVAEIADLHRPIVYPPYMNSTTGVTSTIHIPQEMAMTRRASAKAWNCFAHWITGLVCASLATDGLPISHAADD